MALSSATSHEAVRGDIGTPLFMRAPGERVGSVGSRLEEVVERTRDRLGVMIEREQIAILVGAQAQGLPRRRPVAYRTEHLFTTQDELDWPSHGASCDGAENLRSGDEA